MKIMLVSRVYPTHRPGGMPHVVQDRARELAKQGHNVIVGTTSLRNHSQETVEDDMGVMVHYLKAPTQAWSGEFALECSRLCDRFRPHILHLDSFDRKNLWWSDLDSTYTAITMHGFGWGAWKTQCNLLKIQGQDSPFPAPDPSIWEEMKALAKADVVIGVSRHEYSMLRDEYGLPQARLVYNPIPDYFFSGKDVTEHMDYPVPPSLMGSSSIYDRPISKRTYYVFSAVSGHHTRGAHIAKEACRRVGVEYRELVNEPRESLPEIFRHAKALLLPTAYAQGWDLSIAESRACGCISIVSATGSYLMEAKGYDLLVQPHSLKDLELSIQTLDRSHYFDSNHIQKEAIGDSEVHNPSQHVKNWLRVVQSISYVAE